MKGFIEITEVFVDLPDDQRDPPTLTNLGKTLIAVNDIMAVRSSYQASTLHAVITTGGPKRDEIRSRQTYDQVLQLISAAQRELDEVRCQ